MGLSDLVNKADIIFIGTCVNKKSAWNEGGTQIWTEAEFAIESSLKGGGRRTIKVKTLGGIADGIGQFAAGTSSFNLGERVVLFVKKHKGSNRVVGWNQGKFTIKRDLISKEDIIERNLAGMILVGEINREDEILNGTSLNKFIANIKSLLRAHTKKSRR